MEKNMAGQWQDDEAGLNFWKDLSPSSIVAGAVAVLVGFASSAVIVFEAARASGYDEAGIASWMWALCLGCGLTGVGLSLRYRQPVVTAWSTPGAALLATTSGLTPELASGAFVICGVLIFICGVTRWFERAMSRIPLSLAAAMLAGVLLRFGMDLFLSMNSALTLVGLMFLAFFIVRRILPRYVILVVLLVGGICAGLQGELHWEKVSLTLAMPQWTTPAFSLSTAIGVALPLFMVTMASQYVPGIATQRASGYDVPISPQVSWTGLATLLLAPFGGYAIGLAAITAAICMGTDAHPDPRRRYTAAVASGVFYLVVALLGATVVSFLAAMPREMVLAVAGLALLGTMGNSLSLAMRDEFRRDAAMVTFLATASGVTLFGIGSAFWGLVGGGLVMLLNGQRRV
ncbi:benzoate/H(+) symporter BenE family transporter [Kerstersia gyiorum]|nr:benzoate/H(+) symporter BenE family transporter [Kerstersia gyiorum]